MMRSAVCLVGCLCLATYAGAATLSAVPLTDSGVSLSAVQTGNGDSTNTVDRGYTLGGPVLLTIVTTIGSTPTVTVNIVGSMDGTTFFNVPYALPATPSTFVVTALTITTATTGHYLMQTAQPWRYLKLAYTANTNVTLTADIFAAWP